MSAAIIPSAESEEISRKFKVALGPDGFCQEAHVKLRPVDFAAEGVYLCGTAHYPKHISETINQAYGAAGRALTLLSNDTVVASGSVCTVNEKDVHRVRGMRSGVHLRRHNPSRNQTREKSHDDSGSVQRMRALQLKVPDRGYSTEALYR